MKSIIILIVMILVVFYASAAGYTQAHEKAHMQACLYFGGNTTGNVTIQYLDFGLSGRTYCDISTPEYERHSAMLEATGYPGYVMLWNNLLLSVLTIFGCVIISYRSTRDQYGQ